MNDRKILLFALLVGVYCLYSVHLWFMAENVEENVKTQADAPIQSTGQVILSNEIQEINVKVKRKPIPLFMRNACSILQVFTLKPNKKCKEPRKEDMEAGGNAVTVIGITLFLIVLTVNAVLDVIKVKEEERARRKLNPEGERRQSLAEFANRRPLRRESSKFGLQLFHIAENSDNNTSEDEKSARKQKVYTRGDSTNSYLNENKTSEENSAPSANINDDPGKENKHAKRQSAPKVVAGGRSSSLGRRSSFPALHLSRDVQAAMQGHRQNSVDSDDEEKGRRVRLIRRF